MLDSENPFEALVPQSSAPSSAPDAQSSQNPFDALVPAATSPASGKQTVPNPFGTPTPKEPIGTWGAIKGAGLRGLREGLTSTAQGFTPFEDRPQEEQGQDEVSQLLNQPISQGWTDPRWWGAHIAHGAASSSPALATGMVGSALGSEAGPWGTLAGGAAGFGLGSALQTVAPAYQKARSEGLNHDDAVNRALAETGIATAFASAMGLAPGVSIFGKTAEDALKRPISEALAQIFAVQPGMGIGQAAATKAYEGKGGISPEEAAQAYAEQVGVGAALIGGHKAVAGGYNAVRGKNTPSAPPPGDQGPPPPPSGTGDQGPPPAGQYPNAPESLRELNEKAGKLTPDFLTPKEPESLAETGIPLIESADIRLARTERPDWIQAEPTPAERNPFEDLVPPENRAALNEAEAQAETPAPETPVEAPGQPVAPEAPTVAPEEEAPATPAPVEPQQPKPSSDNLVEQIKAEAGQPAQPAQPASPAQSERDAYFKKQREQRLLDQEKAEQEANAAQPEPAETAAAQAVKRLNDLTPEQQRRQLPQFSESAIEPHGEGEPAGVFMFEPTKLNVDASRFQFKSGGDEYGVTGALRSVSKWDPAKAQAIIVWEQNDGKLFVADGHQRAGLARRLTEQGKATGIKLPGILYREADGISADDMRAIAAVTNIANGSGSALDGAKVLRSRPELMDGSLPLSAGKGQQAAALARLADEPFRMVVNDVVSEHQAAIVGELIPNDPDRQIAAMKAIARFDPRNVEETAALVQRVVHAELAKENEGNQISMFGDLETADSTAGEEMKIVGRSIKDLKKDKTLFARVVANAERIEQTGSHIERGTAKSVVTDADVFAKMLASDAYSAGPVRDELIAAARDLKNGKITLPDASTRILNAIRRQVEENGAYRTGNRQGVARAEEASGAPETGDIFGAEQGKVEPQFELGAEGKPQQLIPGVKPVTDRDRLQAQANAPMRGGNADLQHEGLFGDAQNQNELFGPGTGQQNLLTANAPSHGESAPQGRGEVQGQEHGGSGKQAGEAGEREVGKPVETPRPRLEYLHRVDPNIDVEGARRVLSAEEADLDKLQPKARRTKEAKIAAIKRDIGRLEAANGEEKPESIPSVSDQIAEVEARTDLAPGNKEGIIEAIKKKAARDEAQAEFDKALKNPEADLNTAAEGQKHDIGDRVNFTLPAIVGNGKAIQSKKSGIVQKIDDKGRLYVHSAEGGYHWLEPSEITGNAGAVPGAKERIQKLDAMMAEKPAAKTETPTESTVFQKLKASEVTFKDIKDKVGNSLAPHEFQVDNGGRVFAQTKVTTSGGVVKTAYLHLTIEKPDGSWTRYREQANGNFKDVAAGKGTQKPTEAENKPEIRGESAKPAAITKPRNKIQKAVEAGVIPPEADVTPHINAAIDRIAEEAEPAVDRAKAWGFDAEAKKYGVTLDPNASFMEMQRAVDDARRKAQAEPETPKAEAAPTKAPTFQDVRNVAPSLPKVYKEIETRFGKDGWGSLTPAEQKELYDHFAGNKPEGKPTAAKPDPIEDAVAESISKQDPDTLQKLDEVADAYVAETAGPEKVASAQAKAEKEKPTVPAKHIAAADRLKATAERAAEAAQEKIDQPRNMNTARRARMGSGAIESAQQDLADAKTALKISEALRNGQAGPLENVKSLADVRELRALEREAERETDKALNRPYQPERRPVKPEDLKHLKDANKLRGYARRANSDERTSYTVRDRETLDAARNVAQGIEKFSSDRSLQYTAKNILESIRDFDRKVKVAGADAESRRKVLQAYLDVRSGKASSDPIALLERDLIGMKLPGFFQTPKHLAQRMAEIADIRPGQSVLEPSAGAGRIADAVREAQPDANIHTVEMQSKLRSILEKKGHEIADHDFMEMKPGEQYDRIVMNPPFENGQDMEHVQRAYEHLKPGGRIVAIMGEGAFFRSDKKATAFREWLDSRGTSEKLPEGTFKESGTGTNTRLVTIDKPEVQQESAKSAPAPQWAQDHAKDIAGSVVWHDGDLALLRGFSMLDGHPVYSAAKEGVGRTSTDIASYTGRDFKPEEVEKLKAAREQAIAADAAAHEKNPNGPFKEGDTFAASPSVPKDLAGYAQGMLRQLGIKARVYLTTPEDAHNTEFNGPFAAINSAALDQSSNGTTRKLPNGNHYIAIQPGARTSKNIEVLAHEIGHIFEKEEWTKADDDTRTAIIMDYNKWVGVAESGNAKQLIESLRPHTTGKTTLIHNPDGPVSNLPPYWTSFNEWFADNVSKWAVSAEKPLSLADKFFARLGMALRNFYSKVAGQKYLPAESIKKWLDSRGPSDPLQGAGESGGADANGPYAPSHSLSTVGATTPAAAGGFEQIPDGPVGRRLHDIVERLGLGDIVRDIQMKVTPMASRDATTTSRAAAKDFANYMRQAQWDQARWDKLLQKEFTPEEQKAMWEAADEESVLRQQGASTAGQGLSRLTPRQRDVVRMLQARADAVYDAAKTVGIVDDDSEGLPSYVPRMVVMAGEGGFKQPSKMKGGLPLDTIGRNLTDTTPNVKHRNYLTTAETEAAAKAKFGDEAEVVRNIRTLNIATSRLQQAVAGKSLVNRIKAIGRESGEATVSEGAAPTDSPYKWFTIDHPALKTWRPRLEKDASGSWRAVLKEDGTPVFEQIPVYIRSDFEGPLRAVLSQNTGAVYNALMHVKMNSVGLIMFSPMMHNAVEFGRAFPIMPGKMMTLRVYRDGFQAKNDVGTMREFLKSGGVPIGDWRNHGGDVAEIMNEPTRTSDQGWLTRGLRKYAGDAPANVTGKALDFWHQTLLWDRIADLQMGLYVNMRDKLVSDGYASNEANKAAAHFANRYAGAVPQEAMSVGARKLANLTMFSRSFTVGNLGVIKDMFMGLPSDVQAQIARDRGIQSLLDIKSAAKRKAISAYMLDTGLYYVSNSLLQNAMNTMNDERDPFVEGYARRWNAYLDRWRNIADNPLDVLTNPFSAISATHDNEPGKENRIKIGKQADGTAIYVRNVFGKLGEEYIGWMTEPLTMINKKESTLLRPFMQVLNNDKGFGHKIYNPNAETAPELAQNVGKIVSHILESQLPMPALQGLHDLATGAGDDDTRKTAIRQTVGGILGGQFSTGYPGGEAQGFLHREKDNYEFRLNEIRSDLKKLIKGGDIDAAQKKMEAIGMPPAEQKTFIKHTLSPDRITPRQQKNFMQRAAPEEQERFERSLPH